MRLDIAWRQSSICVTPRPVPMLSPSPPPALRRRGCTVPGEGWSPAETEHFGEARRRRRTVCAAPCSVFLSFCFRTDQHTHSVCQHRCRIMERDRTLSLAARRDSTTRCRIRTWCVLARPCPRAVPPPPRPRRCPRPPRRERPRPRPRRRRRRFPRSRRPRRRRRRRTGRPREATANPARRPTTPRTSRPAVAPALTSPREPC